MPVVIGPELVGRTGWVGQVLGSRAAGQSVAEPAGKACLVATVETLSLKVVKILVLSVDVRGTSPTWTRGAGGMHAVDGIGVVS